MNLKPLSLEEEQNFKEMNKLRFNPKTLEIFLKYFLKPLEKVCNR